MSLNESIVEDATLEWFGELGYFCQKAKALIPAFSQGERDLYSEAVLVGRLREAIRRLNPAISEEAYDRVLHVDRGRRAMVWQYRGVQISIGKETMP
ncbi:hypothetical protein QPK87_03925 [Kamptonema cortianum]|nr:type I restriction endonuclease [Oscillatoria laete-virens]MDK3155728.1 hypothetical protein [Kamptonema cortianum]MDL5048030.1 hypothetical protein [Oscillatoria amoena NRMC-F 0135]MDL5052512.1 hypothetical protein [Oscillatoria laete-virens NRMC-F 0139]